MTKTRKLFPLFFIAAFISPGYCSGQMNRADKQFSIAVLNCLYASAEHFKDLPLKGKQAKSLNDGYKVYEVNLPVPAPVKILLYKKTQESFCSFLLPSYTSEIDSATIYTHYLKLISEILPRKIYISYDTDSLRSAYVGIQRYNYIFSPNLQLYTNKLNDSTNQLVLKIAGGKPTLYNLMPVSIPHQSLLFDYNFKALKNDFYSGGLSTCKTEMAGFVCSYLLNDTSGFYRYSKFFDEEANAKFEFSNLVVNIKANLDRSFVYVNTRPTKNFIAETQFIRLGDINKKERRVICVRIIKNGKKNYQLVIDFIPSLIVALPFP